MTPATSGARPFPAADLGTLVVMAWSGEQPDGDMPYLLAYCLGDGANGPEGSAAAVGQLLEANGLPLGDPVVDATRQPDFPVTLLVEADRVVVGMTPLNAECPVPPEWLTAVGERGHAYFLFTTRPWPEAEPGKPVEPAALAAFVGDEKTLDRAAHALVPARSPH
ncbi:DUF5949 family protein [Streptomyces apricus]|uniref:Uncharacterized protein n=1 Tax=Streptomyces apricus TaxID=1828112 RepID=A0A5A9Z9M5_9ACTN|nr:DUF5949 family protein [Streptomyces apricus]KAA0913856.1 hypothetical protein FGF04_38670 [Streptomyces apricus]